MPSRIDRAPQGAGYVGRQGALGALGSKRPVPASLEAEAMDQMHSNSATQLPCVDLGSGESAKVMLVQGSTGSGSLLASKTKGNHSIPVARRPSIKQTSGANSAATPNSNNNNTNTNTNAAATAGTAASQARTIGNSTRLTKAGAAFRSSSSQRALASARGARDPSPSFGLTTKSASAAVLVWPSPPAATAPSLPESAASSPPGSPTNLPYELLQYRSTLANVQEKHADKPGEEVDWKVAVESLLTIFSAEQVWAMALAPAAQYKVPQDASPSVRFALNLLGEDTQQAKNFRTFLAACIQASHPPHSMLQSQQLVPQSQPPSQPQSQPPSQPQPQPQPLSPGARTTSKESEAVLEGATTVEPSFMSELREGFGEEGCGERFVAGGAVPPPPKVGTPVTSSPLPVGSGSNRHSEGGFSDDPSTRTPQSGFGPALSPMSAGGTQDPSLHVVSGMPSTFSAADTEETTRACDSNNSERPATSGTSTTATSPRWPQQLLSAAAPPPPTTADGTGHGGQTGHGSGDFGSGPGPGRAGANVNVGCSYRGGGGLGSSQARTGVSNSVRDDALLLKILGGKVSARSAATTSRMSGIPASGNSPRDYLHPSPSPQMAPGQNQAGQHRRPGQPEKPSSSKHPQQQQQHQPPQQHHQHQHQQHPQSHPQQLHRHAGGEAEMARQLSPTRQAARSPYRPLAANRLQQAQPPAAGVVAGGAARSGDPGGQTPAQGQVQFRSTSPRSARELAAALNARAAAATASHRDREQHSSGSGVLMAAAMGGGGSSSCGGGNGGNVGVGLGVGVSSLAPGGAVSGGGRLSARPAPTPLSVLPEVPPPAAAAAMGDKNVASPKDRSGAIFPQKASAHLRKERELCRQAVAASVAASMAQVAASVQAASLGNTDDGHASGSNPNGLEFYALGKPLGKGAFGKVNVAVHKLTEELTAVKLCERKRIAEAQAKKSLNQEVLVLSRLNGHANVIQLFEVFETPSHVVLVMEFAAGGDLLKFVRQKRKLDESTTRDLFKQLMDGLHYIHRLAVVHRDIKLENLLLDSLNCVKIADFGVAACFTPGKRLTEHCGTPSYIAPEILLEAGYDGPPVDVWSSGVVLYAMLCGRAPFKGDQFADLKRCILAGKFALPSKLTQLASHLIRSMLVQDPLQRSTVPNVLAHGWLSGISNRAEELRCITGVPALTQAAAAECGTEFRVSRHLCAKVVECGFPKSFVEESLCASRLNHATATYHLLAKQEIHRRAGRIARNPRAAPSGATSGSSSSCKLGGMAVGGPASSGGAGGGGGAAATAAAAAAAAATAGTTAGQAVGSSGSGRAGPTLDACGAGATLGTSAESSSLGVAAAMASTADKSLVDAVAGHMEGEEDSDDDDEDDEERRRDPLGAIALADDDDDDEDEAI